MESILPDKIGDFIDDLNSYLSKMEELRSKFEQIRTEMNLSDENYDDKFGKGYAVKMKAVY